jgi:hypothetical protein
MVAVCWVALGALPLQLYEYRAAGCLYDCTFVQALRAEAMCSVQYSCTALCSVVSVRPYGK